MRFFETVLAGAALVASVMAQGKVTIDKFPDNPQVGKTYTIEYSPKDNTPTTLLLRKGESNNLDTVTTITNSATGGSFQWTVGTALPNGNDYALEVKRSDGDNYSGQFKISGSSASASASVSSAVSSAISSALSSASSSASSESTSKSTSSESASKSASVSNTTLTTSASASVSTSAHTNSTISSATLSSTQSAGTTSARASTTPTSSGGGAAAPSGAASALGSSPLALVFGAVAAMAYLN